MKYKTILTLLVVFIFCKSYSQVTDFDKTVAIGSLLLQSYSAIKGNSSKKADPNAKTVDSFCIKNKTGEKITTIFTGKIEDEDIKKEFVIPKDEKECAYNLPKGIYTYEIILQNKETYQKGEYKVFEETLMTVNKN